MIARTTALAGVLALLGACASVPPTYAALSLPQANDPYFKAGAARAASGPSGQKARNVIIFIGDGMGVSTVTAARIYAGQRAGRDGESNSLTLDTFPHSAFSRTYSDDLQISESASTATAILSGVKTKGGGLGLRSNARINKCEDVAGNISQSLLEIAEGAGLATGIISTARITHATPAATYAHVPNRNWENDTKVAESNGAPCADIARQLVEWPHGDGLEVALGGGRLQFLPNTAADPESTDTKGLRADGRDLTKEWLAKDGRAYVWNSAGLRLAEGTPDAKLLGLFSEDHMAYETDRAKDTGGEPSLKEMTITAINRLKRDPDGYVLMVEGGRIDHAHHEGRAGEALSETVALDEAVKAALDMTSRSDTLIIVTADHSHTLTISGYARRGTPILGLSTTETGGLALARDNKPYTTLGYANGPGAVPAGAPRPDLRETDTTAQGFNQQALVPLSSETHGGEDVPLYAWGPGAANVSGTMEQNSIFHVAARALGFSFR